jgi:hypothetical protein
MAALIREQGFFNPVPFQTETLIILMTMVVGEAVGYPGRAFLMQSFQSGIC